MTSGVPPQNIRPNHAPSDSSGFDVGSPCQARGSDVRLGGRAAGAVSDSAAAGEEVLARRT